MAASQLDKFVALGSGCYCSAHGSYLLHSWSSLDEANGPIAERLQCVWHDTLPWLIFFSLGILSAVRKINIPQVSETAQHSPKGTFSVFRKHISLALGGLKDVGVFGGGHPFDLELVRVPPNRAAWPFHSHSAQWELYVIIAGKAEVRTSAETVAVGVGDVFIHPPGEAHQLRNVGSDDLVYYVIADHTLADVVHYPDSGKWFTKPQRKSFRMLEADYYDGEE